MAPFNEKIFFKIFPKSKCREKSGFILHFLQTALISGLIENSCLLVACCDVLFSLKKIQPHGALQLEKKFGKALGEPQGSLEHILGTAGQSLTVPTEMGPGAISHPHLQGIRVS